jgi:hypothetical protein
MVEDIFFSWMVGLFMYLLFVAHAAYRAYFAHFVQHSAQKGAAINNKQA